MTTKFVIFNPSNQGYWAGHSYNEFKGLLFAVEYNELEEAKSEIEHILAHPYFSKLKLEIKNFYCN